MSSSIGRLPAPLAQALCARGFTDLTPIQCAVLDVTGEAGAAGDLAVSAPTGAGKTLAFGLALVPYLLDAAGRRRAGAAPRAVVAAPTRDLAAQVGRTITWLYAGAGVRVLVCAGGTDRRAERAALGIGADVVVGSPGRLCDHLASGALSARGLGCLVLDEADELMTGGFLAQTRALVRALPPDCRLLLCSATLAPRLLSRTADLRDGRALRFITAAPPVDPPPAMPALVAARTAAAPVVAQLLRHHRPQRAIVFCRRRGSVAEVAAALRAIGVRALGLTGAHTRRERDAVLEALREAAIQVCVATDLAARGLDVEGIGLVVHLGLPHGAEGLIHRNGRAGRGVGGGVAVLIAGPAERRPAEALARRAGVRLDWGVVPPAR